MTCIVQKYGGSSVATVEKIRAVARRVAATRGEGHDVVVVVSAMGGSTDKLLGLARAVGEHPGRRELDLLLASGEQVSSSLLAIALQDLGLDAVALTGPQAGMRTRGGHGSAEISHVEPARVKRELRSGRVVVVAGFQGERGDGELTTLGRGGSDTTAVALAASLDAERCQILSDVDGVYSADPRIVPEARRLDTITHEEMHELARHGARVLAEDAVSFARREGVTIEAAATFGGEDGTTVQAAGAREVSALPVTGVAGRSDLLWLRGRCPGGSDSLGAEVSQALSPLDDLHREPDGSRPLEIVGSGENVPDLEALARSVQEEFGGWVEVSTAVGSVAAVGYGLGARPEVAETTRRALRHAEVEAAAAFSGRHSLSWLVPRERVATGLRSLHACLIEQGRAAVPGGAE